MGAQEALAGTIMADLEEPASAGSPSAAAVLGSFQPGILDTAMCDLIKCGALKAGLSVARAVYGVFSVGKAIAVLVREAWARSGNRKLNQ